MFSLIVDGEIKLHVFQEYQADELFWLVDSNREYMRTWLPWVDNMLSAEQFYTIIKLWKKQFHEKSGFHLAIRHRGILAGSISLHGVDWFNSQASIGYYLIEKMQGKGIITRAIQAVLSYGFLELGLNRIEVRCGRTNYKSQAIPEKLGFIKEGIIRDGEYLNGGFHDLIVYGLLSREWQQKMGRSIR
ncbi:GNAT family protein [Bacillus sp. JJ1609]|uniref:GNAT family N-acetyltransferase n=1 Tax=Bacillus sp. JJ1609 TaxID=3122977 RepID=UPI002FFE00D0